MDHKIGIIGGTNILEMKVLKSLEEHELQTKYGEAEIDSGVMEDSRVVMIRRHGRHHNKPPHVVNHKANFSALLDLETEYVMGMSSVGCLHEEIPLPALFVPHDYIDFGCTHTLFDDSLIHITPGFDDTLRQILLRASKAVIEDRGLDIYLLDHGIYYQFRGPRLETPAEVNVLKQWAHCTGMTAASEATVAKEAGIKYAVLCTMDNYANGVRDEKVDYRRIKKMAKKNAKVSLEIMEYAVRLIKDELID